MKKKEFKVAILGLGYVGLPLYCLCMQKGIDALGFDLSKKKINNLKKNNSYISDISNDELKKYKSKKLFNMSEIKNISDRNIIIFCLPTPILKNKNPDMTFIKNALSLIKDYISDNTILILESTVYPGGTREIFTEFIKKELKKNIKIDFGFSSERISPGQKDKKKFKINYQNIPKVISANNAKALVKIHFFYKNLFKKIYKTKSIEVAEMSKLLENSYRAVNIGLVNEFKVLCKSNDINFHDVISAASTKPFGFRPFNPGPGVGGHCIPIDPLFVSWYARKNGLSADFIELARKKNIEITNWVTRKIIKIFRNLNFKKGKILVIGLAYKEDVNDIRESPSLKIIDKLIKNKIDISYYDPLIPNAVINKKKFYSIRNLNSISLYNVVVLATNHSNLPYEKILDKSKILIDTRGQFKNSSSKNLHFL
jgi:UDP-N-acetyl-D-glucosamine dehydrogenase